MSVSSNGTGKQYDEEFKKQAIKLEELNEFLEETSAFFAANRRKSGKKNG